MKARVLAGLLLLALAALPAAAQVNTSGWGSFQSLPEGRVDRGDLDLHLEFPIFNRATVGRAQVKAVLVYDSQFWQPVNGAWAPETGGGWWLRTAAGHLSETTTVDSGACGWTDGSGTDDGSGTITNHAFAFTEPDGTVAPAGSYISVYAPNRIHPEGYYNDCPPSDTLPITTFIGDGKGCRVVIDNSGAGTAWDGDGDNLTDGLSDPNGNSVTVSAGALNDPLGTALTVSGSGTPSSPIVHTYTGTGATPVSVTENFESVYATGSFGCYPGWSGYLNLPESITYPDSSEYVFSYDSAGRLATLTLPTGGVISYSQSLSNNCSYTTSTLTRSESLDSGKEWLWWNSSGSSSGQTTQTSPDNNLSVFDFDATGALTETDAYSGPSTGTIESETTIATGYSGGTTKTAVTELFGPTPLYSQHQQTFDPFDNLTASSDTDWGTTSPGGAILRQTTAVYGTSGEAEVLASRTVSDGSGNEVSKSTFSYDSHANLLSESDYVTGSTYLTKSYAYNSNGTVHTATDANGGVTTYSYTCGSGFYPSSVQSAIAPVATSATWDCAGGVQLTSTDPNGQTTATAYDDPTHMWRPTSITAPDGSQTTISYISPNQVERAQTYNSGHSTDDVLTTLDALGRPVLSQRRQSPVSGSFDTVETWYDAMDRPVQASMPFTSTAGVGGGAAFTTTTYDEFSRPLVVIDGGGGKVSYAYSQNDTLITAGPAPSGENTKSKQEQFDGLGRLQSVCEINTLGGDGPCGQTVAQSGYLTVYARNALGQITQVTQNAQTTPTQTRTFSFDQLGRLTAEANPESGTTAYTFDSDATCGISGGDLVKRVDANGNTTCYAYDLLHRVTQIRYPSGDPNPTPDKYFAYDGASLDNTSMANVAGRLAEAYTGTPTAKITDLGFSYPNPGADEEDVYQSSPNSGGWTIATAQHYANGAVSTLTLPTGVPAIAYSLDGEGRPVGAMAGTATLAKNGVYSPEGLTSLTLGSNDSDGYQYDASTGRMEQYQFTVGGATDTGTLTWNANGSLGTLGITDNIPGADDTQSCTYTHDDLGRIASAACTGGDNWSQTFSYDSLGNVLKSGTQSFQPNYGINNRISTNINFTAHYDNDGNLLDDPVTPATGVNAFDAEGHAVTLEGIGVTYDALGRAVEAAEPGGTIEFLYGPGGGKLAVMNGQTLGAAYIPLPGGGAAVYHGATLAYYRHADWLGSSRLASTPGRTLYSATAYAPYGEPHEESGATDRNFTGQNQDITGGQYDFLMRVYNPIQGRWWTPDPAGLAAVDPNDPQSWNRYAYVGGTPLEATDPLGLDPCPPGSSVQWCFSGSSVPGLGQQNTPPGMGSGGLDLLIAALQQELSLFWPGSAQPAIVVPGSGSGEPTSPATTTSGKQSNTPCSHGIGVGAMSGGAAEAGAGAAGAGVQGSVGGGLFFNPQNDLSIGALAAGGAVAYAGGAVSGVPQQYPKTALILGAFAGAGGGVFLTNAGSVSELAGPFLTLSANLAVFGIKGSLQLAVDRHWTAMATFSLGAGPPGADFSAYTTDTVTTEPGCSWVP